MTAATSPRHFSTACAAARSSSACSAIRAAIPTPPAPRSISRCTRTPCARCRGRWPASATNSTCSWCSCCARRTAGISCWRGATTWGGRTFSWRACSAISTSAREGCCAPTSCCAPRPTCASSTAWPRRWKAGTWPPSAPPGCPSSGTSIRARPWSASRSCGASARKSASSPTPRSTTIGRACAASCRDCAAPCVAACGRGSTPCSRGSASSPGASCSRPRR